MSGRVHVHALPFGAQWQHGRARFRLWAPACETVQLEFDDGRSLAMAAAAGGGHDGWFEAEADCLPGQGYRYRVREDLAVPDPAARAQVDGVHGYSRIVDPKAYPWKNADWAGRPWASSVIYELHVGTYGAGGSGGYAGVEERLEELAELGVTSIELMPLADFSGSRNWGYDGVLPFAPAAAYGAPEQLKSLIDRAHGLGLCVLLDVVYNHFGPDGNYLHAYAPDFFVRDAHSPWGAAIDFSQPAVRSFFTENALYWLMEYRFDGLRLDAVHTIGDSGWLDEMAARIRATVEPGRQVHLVLENEANTARHLSGDFDAQWNDDLHNALHVALTGEREGYYQNYPQETCQLARCLAEGFAYQGEPFPSHDGRPRGEPSGHLPPSAFISFLQNHDQIGNRALGERLTVLAEPAQLRAAVVLQLLCPQVPMLFMGEEWGSRQPFLFFTDFHDQLADAVREGRRREFRAFKAFSHRKARARIPDPNAADSFRRSIPDFQSVVDNEDAREWRAWYQRLLGIRARELAPRVAGATSLGARVIGPHALLADWQLADGQQLRLCLNLGSAPVGAPIPMGVLLAESRDGAAAAAAHGLLAEASCTAWLQAPP